ncbi:methylisocitrate lyase [Alicyclobacillus ferrooxydans]|uniref:Methylisocitrate lyase n=1 Tax=Alicyclobacillus ferrooxydans TaxID=471514 RepID=A0A0P9CI94_9BACL|nr:methylisocitrate lyase [Alicyclobacillus ferrooxydans]KPV42761.1 methylisocitrate lyase [Alicyclobacillus ferrooxydans]
MTWLVEPNPTQDQLADQFRLLMRNESLLQIPGAHDGMSALLAKEAGFQALYLSGAAYTASLGLPDLGLLYSNEVAAHARVLVRASKLPLLVDIDTGYGGVLNVARTAAEMVEAGVAAVQIEDQDLPKKCGHLNGKNLVATEEMQQKIRMLKQVAPTLVVIARTDAKAVEGIESAIARANAYLAAGADAIFPEALTTEADFLQFRQAVSAPLLANMTEFGKTPYYSAKQFSDWGYDMVIYPVTSLRAAAKAAETAYRTIHNEGTQAGILSTLQTRAELYDTIHYYDYEALDEHIAKTVLPTPDADSKDRLRL